MTHSLVFDDTAITGFFHRHRRVALLWDSAEVGELRLIWPAAAVAAANSVLRGAWSSWHPLLLSDHTTCTPLSEAVAVEVGLIHANPVIGHVVYEARSAKTLIVTAEPARYAGLRVLTYPI